jgi:hypothetical protein
MTMVSPLRLQIQNQVRVHPVDPFCNLSTSNLSRLRLVNLSWIRHLNPSSIHPKDLLYKLLHSNISTTRSTSLLCNTRHQCPLRLHLGNLLRTRRLKRICIHPVNPRYSSKCLYGLHTYQVDIRLNSKHPYLLRAFSSIQTNCAPICRASYTIIWWTTHAASGIQPHSLTVWWTIHAISGP